MRKGQWIMADEKLGGSDPFVKTVLAGKTRAPAGRAEVRVGRGGRRRHALAEKIGPTRFKAYGRSLPPDATFTLRLSYGSAKGHPAGGTLVPWKTSFSGLYGPVRHDIPVPLEAGCLAIRVEAVCKREGAAGGS